jgi:hypothetical protein
MAAGLSNVTFRSRRGGEVADSFGPSILLVRAMLALGLVGEVTRRLWLERSRGMQGLELFLILVTMWASGRLGQRMVSRVDKAQGRALASAFGLASWPSQSAISNGLKAVTGEQVGRFLAWLLVEALPPGPLERAPCTFHVDTRGQCWRVIDSDGRVLAMRQRGLPEGDRESPPPRRRVQKTAAPGYPGRKRGEVQVHRMVVQDAGTGRYVGVRCAPGNGDHHGELIWAARRAAAWAEALGQPLERTLLRFDGKSSGAPNVMAGVRAGLHVLTRWTDYGLLDAPQIQRVLAEARWSRVADSGSAPHRLATEFGTIRIEGAETPGPGSPAEPISLRIVVTRYFVGDEPGRGCGVDRYGWRYELFATTVRAEDWPAAELVELYYGRSGQENRFLQLDAEQKKLRLVTAHLPGLELLVGVGLFLSNWRLLQGDAIAGGRCLPLPARQPRAVDCSPADPDLFPAPPPEPPPPDGAPGNEPDPTCDDGLPAIVDASRPVPQAEPETVSENLAALPSDPTTEVDPRHPRPWSQPGARLSERSRTRMAALLALLVLHLDQVLGKHPGWRWSRDQGVLLCPGGHPARPISAGEQWGKEVLRLRVQPADCRACPTRSGCTSSANPRYTRDLSVALPPSGPAVVPSPRPSTAHPPGRTRPSRALERWSQPSSASPGPYQATAPTLVPTVLRRLAIDYLAACRVAVLSVGQPSHRHQNHPRWIAPSAALRQHRRHTYEQQLALRQQPPARIEVASPREVSRAGLERALALDVFGKMSTVTCGSG